MKLTNPSSHSSKPKFVEVGGYRPGFFARLLGLPIVKAELVPVQASNGTQSVPSMFYVDFEDSPCTVGEPYHINVAFGNQLYIGITPIEHYHGTVYKCVAERIEIIRVERYEPLDYFYM